MLLLSKNVVRSLLRTLYTAKSTISKVPGEFYIDSYTGLSIPLARTSIEHVVPKCYLPRSKHLDMNNLLIIDRGLNSRRSNTKFGRETIRGISFCPDESKGVVARICWHMFDTCESVKKSQKLILSQDLLEEWDDTYPVTDFEKYVNEFVYSKQGTYNKRIG